MSKKAMPAGQTGLPAGPLRRIEASRQEDTLIKDTIDELFKLLEITGTTEITLEEDVVNVALDTEDIAMVIGYHGEMLESLQLVASLSVSKKLGRFVRVSIEVGDYKKNRTDFLTNLALKTKERVLDEGRELTLSNLKSWERRIIHMQLAEDEEVISESAGVGRDRVLVIRPR